MELVPGPGLGSRRGASELEVPEPDPAPPLDASADELLPIVATQRPSERERRMTRQRTNTTHHGQPKAGLRADDANMMASLKAFEVLHLLGEGGFGKVMLVRRRAGGEIFALKAIDKLRTQASSIDHVLAEAEANRKMAHPFVMHMHGAFQDARHFFFLFEYVGGGDLFGMLGRFGAFPLAWCRIYVAEIALALEHIHGLGFLYRDLKTENVLVGNDGHIKLGDFGLATQVSWTGDGTAGKGIAGTLFCMAPEMVRREAYDAAVDWWSLGVVFCDMCLEQPLPWYKVGSTAMLAKYFDSLATRSSAAVTLDTVTAGLPSGGAGGQQAREPPSVALPASAAIAGLLTFNPLKRVHSLAMVKKLTFFQACSAGGSSGSSDGAAAAWAATGGGASAGAAFDWEALLGLRIAAPLASALRDSALVHKGGGLGSVAPHAPAGEGLAAVEKRFATFMDVQTELPSEAIDTSSSALCDAAARGDLSALRMIVSAGGAVDVGDYDKRTAMHLAASEGLLPVVACLIEELHAAHSPLDRWYNTPLDDAHRHDHADVVAYLLSKGARQRTESKDTNDSFTSYDSKVTTDSKGSVLSFANRVRRLSETVMPPSGAPAPPPEAAAIVPTALVIDAAARGDVAMLQALDVELLATGDYDKRTPLHLAASEGQLAVVEMLLARGVPHSPLDRWRNTPLADAARHGHREVVGVLEAASGTRARVGAARERAARTVREFGRWSWRRLRGGGGNSSKAIAAPPAPP